MLPARCWTTFALLLVPLGAQHRVWRVDAPSVGPFGDDVVVIGDRDGDGHDDIVRQVAIPTTPGGSNYLAYAWSYSGRTGQLISAGPLAGWTIVSGGDVDGDGCGDYVVPGASLPLLQCAPWTCRSFEARSGKTDAVLWHVDLQPGNMIGHMLVGDVDLDGDGRVDALIGTNQEPPFGVLYAVSNNGTVLYQISGQVGATFGPGIGKFIDYNGDGCDDFLLGMYVQPNGAVDIRSGKDGSLLRRLMGPPAIWGFGATAAMTGDLDGDGIPDVIAGDSGPFTPGVIAVIGSVTGVVIHQWQVNSVGFDDFGWPTVASADVDRDGFDDIVAVARSSSGNHGQYVLSGRDGSVVQHFTEPGSYVVPNNQAMRPQGNDPFPRWVSHGVYAAQTRTYLFSGAPDGVERTGIGSAGTLSRMPVLGLRELNPSGFRATLSGAEPGAFAILVVGFSQPTLPFFDLSLLGFTNSHLYPQPDVLGFFQAGTAWPNAGYVAHDFALTLVPATTPGALTAYLQWVVFGSGATWPGGVSEAMRVHVQ